MSAHFIKGENQTDDMTLEELNDEFKMIQSGEKRIAIFGTRNITMAHAKLIETLTYSLATERNSIVTSGGAAGVNSAVIRGGLRAAPELLEVVLPQTKEKQPDDVQDLLNGVQKIEEHPERIHMDFPEASKICYHEIIDSCHQLIIFLYHDSGTLAQTIDYAKEHHKIVTVFYLD